MPKRPTIVTLAAAMLIISATFSNRASASSSAIPSLSAITITEKEGGQQKTGKRKKEFQGAGTVTAVSGSIVTILGKDQTLYVVDAGHAAVKKGASSQASLADIRSGDKLFVRGEVTGSEETSLEIFE